MEKGSDISIRSAKPQEIQKSLPSRMFGPFGEMERIFDSFFPRGWVRPAHFGQWPEISLEGNMPSVDIVENDDEIIVRAAVPGVDKKDLDISMTDNTLTIQGKTNHEAVAEKGSYYCCEIMHGAFSRTVALPAEVDVDKAKASFKDGMLEVDLPKMEKSKRRTLKLS